MAKRIEKPKAKVQYKVAQPIKKEVQPVKKTVTPRASASESQVKWTPAVAFEVKKDVIPPSKGVLDKPKTTKATVVITKPGSGENLATKKKDDKTKKQRYDVEYVKGGGHGDWNSYKHTY